MSGILSEAEGISLFVEQLGINVTSGIVQEQMINTIIDVLKNELKDTIIEIAAEEISEHWSPP